MGACEEASEENHGSVVPEVRKNKVSGRAWLISVKCYGIVKTTLKRPIQFRNKEVTHNFNDRMLMSESYSVQNSQTVQKQTEAYTMQ